MTNRTSPLLLSLAFVAFPGVAQAQDPPPPPDPGTRCVCLPPAGEREERLALTRERMVELLPSLRQMAPPRARLGVSLTGDRTPGGTGVIVANVIPGTPAEGAGLRAGDEITHFNDHDISRPLSGEEEGTLTLDPADEPELARFLHLARTMSPGDTVRVGFRREGQAQVATMVAEANPATQRIVIRGGNLPDLEAARSAVSVLSSVMGRGRLGVEVAPMSEEMGRYFGRSDGVLVTQVAENAPVELQPGDVIIAVGDREVRDPNHLRSILASYRVGERITLRVWRDRAEIGLEGEIR